MSKRGDAWERVKLIIALLSLTLYLYSCFCPAFEVVPNELYENRIIHGYACFLFGWLGLPFSIWNLVWCLNPIYLLSMTTFLLRKGERCLYNRETKKAAAENAGLPAEGES